MQKIMMLIAVVVFSGCGQNSLVQSNVNDVVDPSGPLNSYRGKVVIEQLDKRLFQRDCPSDGIYHVYVENLASLSEFEVKDRIPEQSNYTLPISIRKDGRRKIYITDSRAVLAGEFEVTADAFDYKIKLKRIDVKNFKITDENGNETIAVEQSLAITALNSKVFYSDRSIHTENVSVGWRRGSDLECGIDVPVGYKYRVEVSGFNAANDFAQYATELDYTNL